MLTLIATPFYFLFGLLAIAWDAAAQIGSADDRFPTFLDDWTGQFPRCSEGQRA